ncbi:MAG: hypothetical protein ACJAVW_003049 [Spirosomataceae bacterium]|jgi:hypothetical protein
MTRIIFILTVLLIGCSTTNNRTDQDGTDGPVASYKDSLRVDPPVVHYDKDLEIIMTCKVYQYGGKNSINKKVTKTIEYYANGKIASETYKGYKETAQTGNSNATYFSDYKDTLLVQRRSIMDKGDSTKTILSYNQNGQLIKETHYNYERQIRADVDKGLGRPGGCIITEEDYEKERSWAIRSIIHYTYDSLGRKAEYYAPSVHWGSQNRYTWSYNDKGQIKEHRSYDHDRLIWIEEFSYTDTNYQYTRTWFDYDGNPKHLKEKKWEYSSQITCTFSLDKQGRVIEEAVTTEKGEFRGRTSTEHNSNGLIAKTVKYNKDNNPEMTHVYEYEK